MPPCLKNLMGVMGLYEFPSIALSSNDDKPHMLSSSVCLNKPVSSVNSVFLSSSASNVWHLRLVHPNPHALKLVLHDCNISFNNKDINFFCSASCMGKAHRLHSTASQTIYSHPLKLIYNDLWVLCPNTSTLGFKYYMSFVDALSKFT